METRCVRCDAPMSCKPEGDCWCAELPHGPMPVLKIGEATGCLCRNCLEAQLQELQRQGKSAE
ncbi:MAG TPA: cysteine-rich CWC family protein [Candidatus Acidoferrum sp.]|nr:cysteine-rich CWC family protein [Candidatus Acidoferrum sp.]